jgi:DnaJ-class molecular chaperone
LSPSAAHRPLDEYTTCPRCQGSGHWPPSKYAEAHNRQGNCYWCDGYGELTKAEMSEHLAKQKQRRLDMMRLGPDERRHLTKWDA